MALWIITSYTPQMGCLDDKNADFWEALNAHIVSIPLEEYLFLGSNLNGHVGLLSDSYEQVHGSHSHGGCSDNGARILNFVEVANLFIANTFFKKWLSHLITYSSSNYKTQIDFWLMWQHNFKLVKNMKVIPSNNLAPQHWPLILDVQL